MLTEQQEAFCQHYARDTNGARAYLAAYPCSQVVSSTVRSERARRLLRNPRILARIADRRGESRSVWCARSPAQPRTPDDLEGLALLAFDNTQTDIVRLAALRRLDAGLAALGRAASTGNGAATVRVTVAIEARDNARAEPAGEP